MCSHSSPPVVVTVCNFAIVITHLVLPTCRMRLPYAGPCAAIRLLFLFYFFRFHCLLCKSCFTVQGSNFAPSVHTQNGPYYRAGAPFHMSNIASYSPCFIHLLPRHHPTWTARSSEHDLIIYNTPPPIHPSSHHPIFPSSPLTFFFPFFILYVWRHR